MFHEESKIEGHRMVKETWVDPSTWPKEWIEIKDKTYPRFLKLQLPADDIPIQINLGEALHQRASIRDKSNTPLRIEELATILRNSLSFRKHEGNVVNYARRVYPSAGARFPLECYIIAINVKGVPAGLYHYELRQDQLALLVKGSLHKEIHDIFGHDLAEARAIMVLTAQMDRNIIKYGERGYRFALFEAGHLMQNICLVSTSIGIPMTPIGGFADEMLSRLLDLDESNEITLYTCVLP